MRPFLSFKRQEGVFRDFWPLNDVLGKIDPPNSPPEISRRFFWANKKIWEIFFQRKFDRKWAGNTKISADRANMS